MLRLIADGRTTREIAAQLFISSKTADNHIQHIYTKLASPTAGPATRWAFDHGVVDRHRRRLIAANLQRFSVEMRRSPDVRPRRLSG